MKWNNTRSRKANPVKLTHVVQTLVKNLGIGPDIHLEKIKKNWQEIVGVTNSRNTRPVSLKNEILTVAVSSPVWISEVRFQKASFMKKIKEFKPEINAEIKDIRFILESN